MNNLLIGTGGIIGIVVAVVLVIIVLAIVIWYISCYNKFVQYRNRYEEAWAGIDVYLKKRYDLIPNLVETVKGYASHEQDTFRQVTEARSRLASAATPEDKITADKQLSGAIKNFNMVMERYPELKANTNFLDLQNQLKLIESDLAQARKFYNATIKQFNTKRETFPSSIVAKKMGLEKQPYYELDSAEERQNVKVQF